MTTHASHRLATIPVLFVLSLAVGCSPPAKFENEVGYYVQASDSGATVPMGFRRTKDGWEDTSTWQIASTVQTRSIDDWMSEQRERESSWFRAVLEKIRTTPPLMIAVIQITCIAAIVHISKEKTIASRKPHRGSGR